MNKDKNLNELIDGYFKEEIRKPIPEGFNKRLMERIREEKVNDKEGLLSEYLWVILMAFIAVVSVFLMIYGRKWIPNVNSTSEFVTSFKANISFWYQIIAILSSGIFIYYTQIVKAHTNYDNH